MKTKHFDCFEHIKNWECQNYVRYNDYNMLYIVRIEFIVERAQSNIFLCETIR